MKTNWFYAAALTVTIGILTTGASLVWQKTAAAKPSDNAKDVQKGAQPGNNQDQPKPREAKILSGNRARQWREKLDQLITIEFEPNTPLREALSHIADRYKMNILVDAETFKTDQNQPDIDNQPIRLPRLTEVKLVTVLRTILQQVGGDFYIKDDVLTVVPRAYIESGRVLKHPVDVTFSKRPLAEALSELTDLSGLSVVLDPRGQPEDGKLVVTADFRNVPVRDAVRILADMAGMKSIVLDNLLYVTRAKNADQLIKEKEQERERMLATGQ
jgi:hypothetical protein